MKNKKAITQHQNDRKNLKNQKRKKKNMWLKKMFQSEEIVMDKEMEKELNLEIDKVLGRNYQSRPPVTAEKSQVTKLLNVFSEKWNTPAEEGKTFWIEEFHDFLKTREDMIPMKDLQEWLGDVIFNRLPEEEEQSLTEGNMTIHVMTEEKNDVSDFLSRLSFTLYEVFDRNGSEYRLLAKAWT